MKNLNTNGEKQVLFGSGTKCGDVKLINWILTLYSDNWMSNDNIDITKQSAQIRFLPNSIYNKTTLIRNSVSRSQNIRFFG